jgi:hypothetical protein
MGSLYFIISKWVKISVFYDEPTVYVIYGLEGHYSLTPNRNNDLDQPRPAVYSNAGITNPPDLKERRNNQPASYRGAYLFLHSLVR